MLPRFDNDTYYIGVRTKNLYFESKMYALFHVVVGGSSDDCMQSSMWTVDRPSSWLHAFFHMGR